MQIAYVNGEYLPLHEAKISAMDRGFLFADSVYEVIPAYNQKLFRLPQHLQRLHASLKAIKLDQHIDIDFKTLLETLVKKNPPQPEQGVYLQITRGPSMIRDHAFPKTVTPTIFAYCQAISPHTISQLSKGVTAITLADLRWQRCDIKATALLANVLQRHAATLAAANETILLDGNEVLEGTASNVFIVKNNVIFTAPLSQRILGGVTRDLIIELAHKHKIDLREKALSLAELYNADEVWITSSTKEIVPVLKIDDQTIGTHKPGHVWQRMIEYYQAYKQALIKNNT